MVPLKFSVLGQPATDRPREFVTAVAWNSINTGGVTNLNIEVAVGPQLNVKVALLEVTSLGVNTWTCSQPLKEAPTLHESLTSWVVTPEPKPSVIVGPVAPSLRS